MEVALSRLQGTPAPAAAISPARPVPPAAHLAQALCQGDEGRQLLEHLWCHQGCIDGGGGQLPLQRIHHRLHHLHRHTLLSLLGAGAQVGGAHDIGPVQGRVARGGRGRGHRWKWVGGSPGVSWVGGWVAGAKTRCSLYVVPAGIACTPPSPHPFAHASCTMTHPSPVAMSLPPHTPCLPPFHTCQSGGGPQTWAAPP